MGTATSAKRCPECGQVALLQAAVCAGCGHRFRTRFVKPLSQAEARETADFDVVFLSHSSPHPVRRSGVKRAIWVGWLLVICGVILLGLIWIREHLRAKPRVVPVTVPVILTPGVRAARLFAAIEPAMSLYELKHATGGLGRVIRVSNPPNLLLSYDFPTRRISVALRHQSRTMC